MEFRKRNIQKSNRNGVQVQSPYITHQGGKSRMSYLPAIPNGDGTYTVNVAKVIFTGSVTARGEVTAYATATDEVATDIDNQLSDTSARAVENRVITRKINELENRIKELEKMKV